MTQNRRILPIFAFASVIMLLMAPGLASGQSGTIFSTNFGMQCGLSTSNCSGFKLPTTLAQPGTLRLWDSSTYWGVLQPKDFTNCSDIQVSGVNTYCWDYLDGWLDAIAADANIKAVIFTFAGVPCFNGTTQIATSCVTQLNDPNGSSEPPYDLHDSTGSGIFNYFVTALVTHCSPNYNCVGPCPVGHSCKANIIQYYEMWNEANLKGYWATDITPDPETMLEWMILPARDRIWAQIPSAFVMTPSFSFYKSNYSTWVQNWLNAENAWGKRSKALAFHVYTADVLPIENQFTCFISPTTSSAPSSICPMNAGLPSFLYLKNNTPGWATIPWMNTETNWDGMKYDCPIEPSTDCNGQIVRWQLLQDGVGALSVDWYKWMQSIGNNVNNASLETTYYWMTQYLVGGKFPGMCSPYSGSTTIWTCAFTDVNNNSDLWAWTTDTTADQPFPTGYNYYWDMSGGCHTVTSDFKVTVEPYLLVTSACTVRP